MRSITVGILVSALTALTWPAVSQITVTISCSMAGIEERLGIEEKLCREGAKAWEQETHNEIKFDPRPTNSTERLARYRQLLAVGSGEIDVFQIDMVWVGILAEHLIDLTEYFDKDTRSQHFDESIKNNTVRGKLVAMPWFINAGLLYYRQDLLEKYGRSLPETWEDLAETARIVMRGERQAGNGEMWGYVFQGRTYEGLTVNALEWLDSYKAGSIVEPDRRVSVNNLRAVEALTMAASWINTITPLDVLNYAEEEVLGKFQAGNAVFMRHWPYLWPRVNKVGSAIRNKVGITALPKGGTDGKHTSVLGGEQLAVSLHSNNKKEAISLVRYLTSRKEQKRRASYGFAPTISDLYTDPNVMPAIQLSKQIIDDAVRRPSSVLDTSYNEVSREFWQSVHTVLSGRPDVKFTLGQLERTLGQIMRQHR